uniref:Uncharacterized protein n=1 Tax=Lactuca sativa TaxID=4236 RepID=A0A9R1XLY6_LACSA|nr:hypothetical protein LSAT_V11C200066220 [Lactuca sativa]
MLKFLTQTYLFYQVWGLWFRPRKHLVSCRASTAGGGGGMMTPILSTPPQNFTLMDGGSGALTPTDMVPTLANPPSSEAFSKFSISRMLFMCMVLLLA